MSFTAPVELLWLVPFVGALLLLYFLRPRRQTKEVPSLFLWKTVAQNVRSDRPFQRLRVSLLLILQLLALLLILLGLGLPLGRPKPILEADYALILDSSASMKATDVAPSRFAEAQREAEQFVRTRMAPHDQAAIILAGTSPAVLCPMTTNANQLIASIASASPKDAVADVPDAIAISREASSKPLTAIYVFSDDVWATNPSSERPLMTDRTTVSVVVISSRAPSNVGIVGMSERTDPLHQGLSPQLLVSVDRENSSRGTLTITANGKVIGRNSVPSGTGTMNFSYSLSEVPAGDMATASLTGMVRDDLATDNSSRLVLRSTTHRRILLVSDGDAYLERALSLLPGVDLYEVPPSQYVVDEQYDAVVFDGWLPDELPKCPQLVFGALDSEMPVAAAEGVMPTPKIVDWDDADPLLSYVDLSTVNVRQATNVRLAPWGTDVADFQLGPAIARGEEDGRNIIWVAFAPRDSDFPLEVAFPIFLSNSIDFLASSSVAALRTGDPLQLPSLDGLWSVTTPDGHVDEIGCSGTAACEDPNTSLAGIYRASSQGEEKQYAVNLASRTETELTASPVVGFLAENSIQMRRSVQRTDFTPWLVAAALLVILAEWLIYSSANRYTSRI